MIISSPFKAIIQAVNVRKWLSGSTLNRAMLNGSVLNNPVLKRPALKKLELNSSVLYNSVMLPPFVATTCFVIILLFTLPLSLSLVHKVHAQEVEPTEIALLKVSLLNAKKAIPLNTTGVERKQLPSHLSEKFYRQALYFYFQNKPDEALNQLNINQEYFSKTPVHESLFRVGLQISQGLHQNAQALLAQLSVITADDKFIDNNIDGSGNIVDRGSDHDTVERNLKKETLKVIVFLQLAEQKIAQNDLSSAQNILANISAIPEYHSAQGNTAQGYADQDSLNQYYLTQYYIMQQLITWPEQPNIESFNLSDKNKTQLKNLLSNNNLESQAYQTPYIILNEALSAMNQREFVIAEEKLKSVQSFKWQEKTEDFWQQLFADEVTHNKALTDLKQTEQNGINHYAQLLLAQLYIEKGLFQQGYNQLESFPKNTPFTEQALFLFGYSAFKLQRYNVSEIVLNALITQYPYANFTQQAWALSAEQYTAQNQLNKALNRYLQIEKYYQTKQQELSAFANTLTEQKDLLSFFKLLIENKSDGKGNSKNLNKDNQAFNQALDQGLNQKLWLTLSLRETDIATSYQQLQSVDNLSIQLQAQQNKSDWLANTIELNTVRRNNIRAKQKNNNTPRLLKQLAEKRNRLTALLNKAESLGNGELFAAQTEKRLLARIANSKNALAFISEHKQDNRSTVEYQQRLERVQGVLFWQLQQTFPVRYWQTRESLNTFDRTYNKALHQHEKVSELLSQKGSLSQFTHQHKLLNNKVTLLLEQTAQIKARINSKLFSQSTLFIENEHMKIKQFLLFNQRAMANVIEKLNQQEAY